MDPVAEFTANESESWNSGIGSGWQHLDWRVVALSRIDAPALEAGGRCLCAGIVNANAHREGSHGPRSGLDGEGNAAGNHHIGWGRRAIRFHFLQDHQGHILDVDQSFLAGLATANGPHGPTAPGRRPANRRPHITPSPRFTYSSALWRTNLRHRPKGATSSSLCRASRDNSLGKTSEAARAGAQFFNRRRAGPGRAAHSDGQQPPQPDQGLFLRGFRGIATKYLDSCLRWFHLIELGDPPSPRACLEAARAKPCLRFAN